MTQQAEYYLPSIEELHVGFHYELWFENDQPYGKCRVGTEDYFTLKNLIENKQIWVKYLDDTDIKELGWIWVSNSFAEFTGQEGWLVLITDETDEFKVMYFLYPNGMFSLDFTNITIEKVIANKKTQGRLKDIVYSGKCYNKSELKFLMKRLGIKNS
jgi:hypothetical protein